MSQAIAQRDLIRRAFLDLGVFGVNDPIDAASAQTASELLAELIDSWNTQRLTVLVQNRNVYDLESGRGGPDDPYTIGPSGDFDTGAAARPDGIRTANLLLNTTSDYPTEIPLAILTDDMYAANPIKSILNSQPSTLYYQRSVPLGQIQLWNIPNTDANQLVLYTDLLTGQFPDQTTLITLAPGYLKAFRLCLEDALITGFSVPPSVAGKVIVDAYEALRDLKCANAAAMMGDLSLDPAFTPNTHGTYVIQTDQGA